MCTREHIPSRLPLARAIHHLHPEADHRQVQVKEVAQVRAAVRNHLRRLARSITNRLSLRASV